MEPIFEKLKVKSSLGHYCISEIAEDFNHAISEILNGCRDTLPPNITLQIL
jgi:hypothetical protein